MRDFNPSEIDSSTLGNADVSFEEPLRLTRPEQEAQGMIDRIKGLTEQLPGRAEYKAEKEEELGLPAEETRTKELEEQLFALQAKAQAIPIEMKLEPETGGRAATTQAIQSRRQAEAIRLNTLKALQTSILLNASRGRLARAEDEIEEAVSLKYDPIQEDIDATMSNLKLIQESPRYSAADKRRATKQAESLEKKQTELEEDKSQESDILNFTKDLIKAGFNDVSVLTKIQNATEDDRPSLAEAQRIAAEGGALDVYKKEEVTGFSPTQELKLEQAGLANAPRQQKLDFLYGEKAPGEPTPEVEIKTFEESLAEAEEDARMTFSPEMREQFRKAYDEEVKRIRSEVVEKGTEAGGFDYEDL